jgi:hypothetical protein
MGYRGRGKESAREGLGTARVEVCRLVLVAALMWLCQSWRNEMREKRREIDANSRYQ